MQEILTLYLFSAETLEKTEELAEKPKKKLLQLRGECLCKVCFWKLIEKPTGGDSVIQTSSDLSKTNQRLFAMLI